MNFEHVPVMFEETISNLHIRSNGIYVDATLGGGGHASGICEHLDDDGVLIGIDQDIDALNAAQKKLAPYRNRKIFVHENFSNIKKILAEKRINGIDGAILDLGVSSYQLDEVERGFSYMQDTLLDMRMDRTKDFTAEDVVNEYSEERLADIIWKYGEERWAKRIANFIVKEREIRRIRTTGQLVDIIKKAIPASARRSGPHPAKRTFQAIRIEVNNELEILEKGLQDFIDVLNPGGRICVISFHSLEDRIVKNVFKESSTGCICPPEYPVCNCNRKANFKVITKKPIVASTKEIEKNPRSRSAKLRVGEKI
ncbi:MAG TPA: 16S rRNA (cytosine(1402)-N(4))-methyltransferase RsmH [Clostridiales bacterium]|nr:16S rRNA (cytosine(1402)-N(4))-methyltransferase RsmH [Clostridiales bacterium]